MCVWGGDYQTAQYNSLQSFGDLRKKPHAILRVCDFVTSTEKFQLLKKRRLTKNKDKTNFKKAKVLSQKFVLCFDMKIYVLH